MRGIGVTDKHCSCKRIFNPRFGSSRGLGPPAWRCSGRPEYRRDLVSADEVPAGEVLAGEVLAGEVPAGEVLAGEVLAGEVLGLELLAGEIPAGKVTADEFLGGKVPAGEYSSAYRAARNSGREVLASHQSRILSRYTIKVKSPASLFRPIIVRRAAVIRAGVGIYME
jgi:hypothetical protein